MRQCSRCLEVKEDSEFSPLQGRCRPCRAEVQRFEHLERRGKKAPIPNHLAPSFYAVKKLLKGYAGTGPLPIPVRAFGNPIPAPNACVLRDGFYHIASTRGARTLEYATTGPLDLIRNLIDLGLEIHLA